VSTTLQLLGLELVLKLAGGLVLLFVPLTSIKVLGLPRSETPFWPRLLGAVLIALALSTYMDASARLGRGLSLGGSFVINVTVGLVLASMLYLKQGSQTKRGRIILWLLTAFLLTLAAVELAYI
jgi:hypothetical protein